ncbi:hypothetical protein [Paludisphaera sp.]|uniref:hypothetical protein n=1 Tax=Paludisphaera sp. TaxID=2017432 RepID=UPI00301DC499
MKVYRLRSSRIAAVLAGLGLAVLAAHTAGAAEPAGIWTLVVLGIGEDEYAIVDLHRQDGNPRGVLLDGRKNMFERAAVADVRLEDGKAGFTLKGERLTLSFSGVEAKEGVNAGRLVGTVALQGSVFPARMERTLQERIGAPKQPLIGREYFVARGLADPKARARALRGLIKSLGDSPVVFFPYTDLLESAGDAGLSTADVDSLIDAWREGAATYGPDWVREVDTKAAEALAPQKSFAATALKLAKRVDETLPDDTPTAARQGLARLLATAARNAGEADVAAEAEGRVAKLEAQLDEEYHRVVPPFEAPPYPGRKSPDAGRPVVMELFTGAQCPPCVAADVAFDGLLKSFEPTEFIGLQYHLHIPGPDPLANPDAIERQQYYGQQIGGTPTTFVNGRTVAPGGGGMAASESKYQEYRRAIDPILEEKKQADVTVTAERSGDVISVVAEAAMPWASKGEAPKKAGKSSIKLRLALTEESVRYVGGNRLRFHHHVVRALPGGAEGTALVDGRGKVEIKVDLAELRKSLEGYVAEQAEQRPFFGVTPDVALENLGVAAFVQDDLDKSILGAASVPARTAAP